MVRSVPANPNQGAWVPHAALVADRLLVQQLVCPLGSLPAKMLLDEQTTTHRTATVIELNCQTLGIGPDFDV